MKHIIPMLLALVLVGCEPEKLNLIQQNFGPHEARLYAVNYFDPTIDAYALQLYPVADYNQAEVRCIYEQAAEWSKRRPPI